MRVCGLGFGFVLSLDSFPLEKEGMVHICFMMFDTSAKVAWMTAVGWTSSAWPYN